MPLKCYCPKCVEPILYDLAKPSFCPFCGTNLNNNISVANQKYLAPPINKSNIKSFVEDAVQINEDDNIEIQEQIDSIEQLDVEIVANQEQSIKFGDLAQQQKTGIIRPKIKKINKKEEILAFRKEAGLGGRQTIEITDNGTE